MPKCTEHVVSSCVSQDFLAPYLLSSIDRGAGMIRMLNETPIQYLTWGNHEADPWCNACDLMDIFMKSRMQCMLLVDTEDCNDFWIQSNVVKRDIEG